MCFEWHILDVPCNVVDESVRRERELVDQSWTSGVVVFDLDGFGLNE